jgi:ABC-type molybdate transport system ATPase subunit
MSSTNLLATFNDQFERFVLDIQKVFPQDPDILTAKKALLQLRKGNPKLILKVWKAKIVAKYRVRIEAGDIEFFLNNDYSEDVGSSAGDHSDLIMQSIARLRGPLSALSGENKVKILQYVQQLTKISDMISV